jgi:hypothetical protein
VTGDELARPVSGPGRAPLPELRASDAERDRAADQLRQAAGDGRLTVDELDERLTRCYGARTVGELAALTLDVVPTRDAGSAAAPAGAVPVRPGPGGTGTIVAIMGGNDRRGRWRQAERRLRKARERGELGGG